MRSQKECALTPSTSEQASLFSFVKPSIQLDQDGQGTGTLTLWCVFSLESPDLNWSLGVGVVAKPLLAQPSGVHKLVLSSFRFPYMDLGKTF